MLWPQSLQNAQRTGISVRKENQFLPIERSGYVEETFILVVFHAIIRWYFQDTGFLQCAIRNDKLLCWGSQNGDFAATKVKRLHWPRTTKCFYKGVLDGLEDDPFDVPFALLYSVVEGDGDEESTISSGSADFSKVLRPRRIYCHPRGSSRCSSKA